jgi:hypothetical protein
LLLLAPLLLGGCLTNGYPGRATCDAKYVAKYLGQDGTERLGKRVQRRSRADRIRWVRPGTVVTMDYIPTRLNIELDEAGKVKNFKCG